MKGQTLFEKMTHISDKYVAEAALGDAYGNPRREREEGAVIRFFGSGWGVAMLCAITSLAAVIAMAAWGRMSPVVDPPPSGDPSVPPITQEQDPNATFTFDYRFPSLQNTFTATSGETFSLRTYVTNRGDSFSYTGSSSGFSAYAKFVLQNHEDTVIHGAALHSEDYGTIVVERDETGTGTTIFSIPMNATAGVYDLVLSYGDDEQVFPGVLIIQSSDPEQTGYAFEFGCHILSSNLGVPVVVGNPLTLDVWVKNTGPTFTFTGSSMGFIPDSYLRHSESGYTIVGTFYQTMNLTQVTVLHGQEGRATPRFAIPSDAPSGSYELVLSITVEDQTFEQVFPNTVNLVLQSPEPRQDGTLYYVDESQINPDQILYFADTTDREAATQVSFNKAIYPVDYDHYSAQLIHRERGFVMTIPFSSDKLVRNALQTGDLTEIVRSFEIHADTPTGSYDLVLTYGEFEQHYKNVRTISSKDKIA